jgi:hypothetical protein
MSSVAFPAFAGAASRRQVATWSCSRTPLYAPLVKVAVVFPSRGLRTELDAPLARLRAWFLSTPKFFRGVWNKVKLLKYFTVPKTVRG